MSFLSEGSVSPVGVSKTEKPAVVLRKLGTAQTVMSKSVLPLFVDTDLHKSVLVECIGDTEYQSLPLHKVCLKSKYMTGDVTVDHSDVQGNTNCHMTFSETLYNDWCEPLSVENPTTAPRTLPELVKDVDLKLPNSRKELIEAQRSDTDLVELYNKALSVEEGDLCVTL